MPQSLGSEKYHHSCHGFTASWSTLLFDAQTKSRESSLLMRTLSLEKHSAMESRGGWPMTEFFHRQAALDPSLQWNVLHPAIQASTLFLISPNASQGPSVCTSTFCSPYCEVDHTAASCTLGYLHYPNSAPT